MMDKPKKPVQATSGRYAPPLWEYRGKVVEGTLAAAMYERDRARYYLQKWRELSREIPHPR